MARRKYKPKGPKYNIFTITTRILALQVISYPDGKIKSVLDCESKSGKPRRCIYWQLGQPTGVQVGDEVTITGRIENEVFLIYKLLYDPQKRKQTDSEKNSKDDYGNIQDTA